jgi:hypothetical protein
MKKRVGIAVLLVGASIALAIWARPAPSALVCDVRQAEILVLGEETGNPSTYAISIRGSGQIDGEATVSLLLNGRPNKVEKLRRMVDFQWGGDWYSETAKVQYEPSGVRSGKVVLHYNFHKI